MKVHDLKFTDRQVTLIRVALMQRIGRLAGKPECQSSYDDSKAMMIDGPLSLVNLSRGDIPKEVRKTKRQREIEALQPFMDRSRIVEDPDAA